MADERVIVGWDLVGYLENDGSELKLIFSRPSGLKTLAELVDARKGLGDSFVVVTGNDVKIPLWATVVRE